jgi:hypothetical protein
LTIEEDAMVSILDGRTVIVLGMTLGCAWSSNASAQAQPQPQPAPAQQQPAPAQQPPAKELPGPLEETPVKGRDYAPESAEPQPPGEISEQQLEQLESPEVALDAGVGSEIAYASQSIVELGGTLAFWHASQTTEFSIAPSVGYFVADNLELTLFPQLRITDVDGSTDFSLGVFVEPSYHVPLSERFFAFAGIGIGLRYSDDPGFDFALRPKIGVDILIGRSGVLKPAAFLDIGTNDGLTQGGVEASFTVIL